MAANPESPIASPGCEVRQTRDTALVQRAFDTMVPEARDFLWEHLAIESRYEPGELPDRHTRTGQQLLWHELLKTAHQTAGTFFVVTEYCADDCDPIFVSADWTSAHAWARRRIAAARPVSGSTGGSSRSEGLSSGTLKKPPAAIAAGND